jgi:hypothetical protein
MSASQWDRINATISLTFDDTAGDNIFGENCLKMLGGVAQEIVVKDTELDLENQYSEFDFYYKNLIDLLFIESGVRVQRDSNDDGYFIRVGGSGGGGYFTRVYKRISGIYTQIGPSFVFGLSPLIRYHFTAIANGTGIEFQVKRFSDNVIMSSGVVADASISGPGSAAVRFSGNAGTDLFIDNFKVSDVV